MKKSSIVMLLPFMLGACIPDGRQQGQVETSDSVKADSILYSCQDTIPALIRGTEMEGDPTSRVSILLELPAMPKQASDTLCSQLAAILSGDGSMPLHQAIQQMVDSIRQEYCQELTNLYSDTSFTMSFAYEYTYDNKLRLAEGTLKGVIGYEGALTTFQGGAHGGYSLMLMNFRSSDGHLIKASDVLDTTKEDQLLKLIRNQMCKDFDCKSVEELQDKHGLLMLGDVYVSDFNFLLLQDGVRFHYDPYDIGPWAAGEVNVAIPYSSLGNLFKGLNQPTEEEKGEKE